MDRQAEHRIDLYITKNFTDKFKIQYNPTFYQKLLTHSITTKTTKGIPYNITLLYRIKRQIVSLHIQNWVILIKQKMIKEIK